MEDTDVQLQMKKRARRRLVGAVAFFSIVAVVLPLVMDHEPRQPVQDVEIRIPGQDEKPFVPKFAAAPDSRVAPETPPAVAPAPVPATVAAPVEPTARVVESSRESPAAETKPATAPEKLAAKPAEKAPEKVVEKSKDKAPEMAAAKPSTAKEKTDAQRAADILSGKGNETAAAKSQEFVILIGAFSNEANVRTLKTKMGELGIKVYTEPLDSPQGRKIRVRGGPFPSRDAADVALARMNKIGVSGVIAAR